MYTERMDGNARAAIWWLVITTLGFKLWATVLIYLMVAQMSPESLWLLIATNLPHVAGVLVVVALPVAFWVRLLRVRARRKQLLRAEWCVDERASGKPSPVRRRSTHPRHPN